VNADRKLQVGLVRAATSERRGAAAISEATHGGSEVTACAFGLDARPEVASVAVTFDLSLNASAARIHLRVARGLGVRSASTVGLNLQEEIADARAPNALTPTTVGVNSACNTGRQRRAGILIGAGILRW